MLKEQWVKHCCRIAAGPADFFAGCRKIVRSKTLVFDTLDDSLQLSDAGYTTNKLSQLTRNYLHQESRDIAIQLWDKRRGQAKYGSVGFTCYAHFVKGGTIDAKRSKRASVFGPCIQSVVITWLSKKSYSIDIMYRTTELFKKLVPDLVFLRDVLLADFNFEDMSLDNVSCHFANVTAHPMYWITVAPSIVDPIAELERLRHRDSHMWNWTVRWSARYLCPEHHREIEKFSQALRVGVDALNRLDLDTAEILRKYCRINHTGFRNSYEDPDNEGGDK